MTQILFFAQLREDLGCDSIELDLQRPCSVTELRDRIVAENPQWQAIFKHSLLLCSVNQTLADFKDLVTPGDEVAFFPPVTGG
ncbi:MAG: molybdopterin synthase sulfur carrier subunit [Candidatus Pelagadaptatus aseana]|uniref:MoaD/ThiS family protein n=1 Tax=Candidatus Pelagadaptatus aseana TaxID=3120508 RepID=UPI0039B33F0D